MGSLSFTREGSSSARVLPLKIYTPSTNMDEDKENCHNQVSLHIFQMHV
jgi:hypothetical protein